MEEDAYYKQSTIDNKRQRVMVFQGGAALGAYEAGCYKELYNWIKKRIKDDENAFDIIAGTSIGAINASILVSYVKERRDEKGLGIAQSWEGSSDVLERFWIETSTLSFVEKFPAFALPWIFYFSEAIKESKELLSRILRNWYSQTKSIPYVNQWYDFLLYYVEEYFDTPASKEAARRYYSANEFQRRGANNVFLPLPFGIPNEYIWPFYYAPTPIAFPKLDFRFGDNLGNLLFRYTNQPLRKILQNYIKFPIATSFNDDANEELEVKEPRLLIISIDVQDGATVTFDSYTYVARECKICNKEFQDNKKTDKQLREDLIRHVYRDHGIPYHDEKPYNEQEDPLTLRWSVYGDEQKKKYCISYSKGIELKHVISSASVPIVYDYEQINAREFDSSNPSIKKDHNHPPIEHKGQKVPRYFWDGQYLSNTPLRELFGAHTIFWKNKIGEDTLKNNILPDDEWRKKEEQKSNVPDLEIYIANVWPRKEEGIPYDHDGQADRKNDIMFHDKSEYDEKVARFVTDYIDLIKELVKVGSTNKAARGKIEEVLDKNAETVFRDGKHRKYWDLLIGRFDVKRVIRIERTDDPDAISEKWGDYSYGSIYKLFEQGRIDALRALIEEELSATIENNISDTEMKQRLKIPLNKAIEELARNGHEDNIVDRIKLAYNGLYEFQNRLNEYNDRAEKPPDTSNIQDYLTRSATHIAERLDPESWNNRNLGMEIQQRSEAESNQIISTRYTRPQASSTTTPS